MRAAAEIKPFPLAIDGDGLAFGQIFNQLGFKFLAHITEELDRLIAVPDLPLELVIAVDDEGHLLFNRGEVFVGKGLIPIEIIIKAIFNDRANGHMRTGEKLLYRFGQHMGRIVTDKL